MTFQDLANNDITPENSTLQSREFYKGKPKIMNAFTEDGKFNEKKFEGFYQSALSMYNQYSRQRFEKNLLDTYEYDPFDYFALQGGKTRDVMPRVDTKSTNMGIGRSITGLNSYGRQIYSPREIAQMNNVYN